MKIFAVLLMEEIRIYPNETRELSNWLKNFKISMLHGEKMVGNVRIEENLWSLMFKECSGIYLNWNFWNEAFLGKEFRTQILSFPAETLKLSVLWQMIRVFSNFEVQHEGFITRFLKFELKVNIGINIAKNLWKIC